ncbi:MAG: glycosyltransferase [Chthoniobacterales bacterium]
MTSQSGDAFRLNVLNPAGNDPEQDFSQEPAMAAHAPVNFHAYAACTGGIFFRDVRRAVAAKRPVLLLLRGDFGASERALLALKKARVPVVVSLKETGLHQIAEQLDEKNRLTRFLKIVRAADGYIAPTPEAADFCRTVRGDAKSVAFIPTPYPLHDERWNFSRPIAERKGIMIGTREWDIPTRNHTSALIAAYRLSEATGEPVTTYNCDGRREEKLVSRLDFRPGQLTVHNRTDTYGDYLRVMAAHKIVFQLDTSFVPGQVAGDALICRLPCVGGNGTIERIAFPELCGQDRLSGKLLEMSLALLRDDAQYLAAIAAAQARAGEHLSFACAARALQEFVSVL